MKNYLIIDHDPPASRALRLALIGTEGTLTMNQTSDPVEIREQLASGQVTAVFARIELWDHRLFPDFERFGQLPELVLLGRAEQKPTGCCGIGIPEFLADDFSTKDFEKMMKYINSSFIQAMDYRFVLANDGDKVIKVDLREIRAIEAVSSGCLIHSACGVFTVDKTIEEMEALRSKEPVS